MKWLWRIAGVLLLLLLIIGIALWFTVRTEWFAEQVRTRIVTEAERATGAKVELEKFRFDPSTWIVSADGFTLHGTESATEPPLVKLKSASIGWKLISLVDRKVNVVSIEAIEPEIYLHRDAQGRWNLPRAQTPSTKSPFDRFIDLKAGRIAVKNGIVRYQDQIIPLDFDARDAEVSLALADGPAYAGTVKTAALRITRPFFTPIALGVETKVRMDHTGIQFDKTLAQFGGSKVTAKGRMLGWTTPRLEAEAGGEVRVADLKRPLRLPIEPHGTARFSSKWTIATGTLEGAGTLNAAGLDWQVAGVRLNPVAVKTDWQVRHNEALLDNITAQLLGGEFRGKAEVTNWREYQIDGEVADLAVANLSALRDNRAFPWSATINGPISGQGNFQTLTAAKGDLTITRSEGALPVDGAVAFDYDVAVKKLTFAPSHIELPQTRADFSGDPATRLDLRATSANLDEILPALDFFASRKPNIPVQLESSSLRVEGAVTNQDNFRGVVEAGRFAIRDARYPAKFDGASAAINATPTGLRIDSLRLRQQPADLRGALNLTWNNGEISDNSAVTGQLQLTGLDLAKQLALLNTNVPADLKPAGIATATLNIAGTIAEPNITGNTAITGLNIYGESIDRFRTNFRYAENRLEFTALDAASGRSTATGSLSYQPTSADWRSGRARFDLTASEGALRRWVTALPEGFEAAIRGNAKGELTFTDGRPALAALDGNATIPQLTMNGRPLGDANITVNSQGRAMAAEFNARMLGSQVRGNGEFSLSGTNPGLGQVRVTGLTLDNLRTLGVFGDPNRPLGARGSLDAEFGFSGPIFRPDQWTSTAKVTRIEIEPRPTDSSINTARFALRNPAPLTGTIDRRGVTIESARLVGEGTDLSIGGAIGIKSKTPYNLSLRGSFNLSGLSVLEPDLEASGVSTIDATVRGELYRPAIGGRMEVSNAAFRLRNVPNGLDQVTGIIRFDNYRASIERLTAQTGGGNLSMTGFIGFGGPQLTYRLQAEAQRVRVRYPDEVSTTFDGRLALAGTSAQSLLSGDVSVARVALQQQTDIGGLLQATARSAQSAPTQNAFLRAMQLDIHVVTRADAELQTSLTSDLAPQAELTVKGTGARPVALGRITLSEGELTFTGTRYKVNRGEISLFNPVRTEPVVNFDLETTVRGITVNINLAGAMDKLNTSYRSDPPLQSNEIITLLAVGQTSLNAQNASTFTPATSTQQAAGGGSLLTAAVASPVSGRLQRLFGTRVNIDPDLNSTSPQARLTIEQQVNREIRLTYITNLNRTQNQIVRMQWDLSPDYSLIAVRDENGMFGVDVLYRKRFK